MSEKEVKPFRQAGIETWVPCLVLAHALALFFVAKALVVLNPQLWRKIKNFLLSPIRRAPPAPPSPSKTPGAGLWRTQLDPPRPSAPMLLAWDNIGCQYNTPHGLKTVLKDVSGAARPYELLALMGPSGAGKSTLLDILAARKTVGRLTGAVTVNGAPRGSSFVRHISYVPQEDNFLPSMTVAETCELHAALTLPRGTPAAHAAARIEEVLAAMGMLHARDTLVGGVLPGGLSLRGISGGERRRVSVAIGILAAPSIVFLDEPTSGLDSCSALAVVEHLKDRARDSGLTVVASIHQPRAAVWACFDACAVLSQGLGMYQGRSDELVAWFEGGLGYGPWDSAVHGTNSDWVMDLVNVGFSKAEVYGITGRTIVNHKDLELAAQMFAKHYRRTQQKLAAEAAAAAAKAKVLLEASSFSSSSTTSGTIPAGGGASGAAAGGASAAAASNGAHGAQGAQAGAGDGAGGQGVMSASDLWQLRPQLAGATLAKRSSAGGKPSSAGGAPSSAGGAGAAAGGGGGAGLGGPASPRHPWKRQLRASKGGAKPVVVVDAPGAGHHAGGGGGGAFGSNGGGARGSASGGGSGFSDACVSEDGGIGLGGAVMAAHDKRRPSYVAQFKALFRRELLATMRNPADVAGRMLLFAHVGFFCGLVFWRLGDGFDAVRNRINLLFVQQLQFMLLPYVYMSLYAADRVHFTADISARLYSPGPYYLAKTLANLPFALANVLFSTYIVYGMTGLRLSAFALGVNGVASALLYLIAQQVQALAAILMPNEDAAFLLTIGYTTINLYMSNFVIRFQDMQHRWLSFLKYTSAVNFAYAAVMKAEFEGESISCTGGVPPDMLAGVQSLLPDTPQVRSPIFTRILTQPNGSCRLDMDAILEYFNVTLPVGAYIGALLLHLAAMHAATFGGLLLLAKKERR